MEDIEEKLKYSVKVGVCPETGIETNFEYVGKITIHKPKKHIWYNLHCPVCNKQHYLHEIKYFRFWQGNKWVYINKEENKERIDLLKSTISLPTSLKTPNF